MCHSIHVTIEAPYCPVWWWAWEHCDTALVPGLETGQIKMGDVITDPRLIVVPDSTNNNTGELRIVTGRPDNTVINCYGGVRCPTLGWAPFII